MYPFVPKSTSKLLQGQFWAVPLEAGNYACGRVLQVKFEDNPTPTRAFFGCLMDWLGPEPPTSISIAGSQPVHFGVMHVRAIVETGGSILGERPLSSDQIELPVQLSQLGGPGTQLLRGAVPVRTAKRDEWGKYPILGGWGYTYIKVLAEHLSNERGRG